MVYYWQMRPPIAITIITIRAVFDQTITITITLEFWEAYYYYYYFYVTIASLLLLLYYYY